MPIIRDANLRICLMSRKRRSRFRRVPASLTPMSASAAGKPQARIGSAYRTGRSSASTATGHTTASGSEELASLSISSKATPAGQSLKLSGRCLIMCMLRGSFLLLLAADVAKCFQPDQAAQMSGPHQSSAPSVSASFVTLSTMSWTLSQLPHSRSQLERFPSDSTSRHKL